MFTVFNVILTVLTTGFCSSLTNDLLQYHLLSAQQHNYHTIIGLYLQHYYVYHVHNRIQNRYRDFSLLVIK